jgi:hypothetical protein
MVGSFTIIRMLVTQVSGRGVARPGKSIRLRVSKFLERTVEER